MGCGVSVGRHQPLVRLEYSRDPPDRCQPPPRMISGRTPTARSAGGVFRCIDPPPAALANRVRQKPIPHTPDPIPDMTEKVVIIGSGPAAWTAAIYAARAQLNPLVIQGNPLDEKNRQN